MSIRNGQLFCDMRKECQTEVTHMDEKGYAYCTEHGVLRRQSGRRCRALQPWEIRWLKAGKQLRSYEIGPEPKTEASA